MNTPKVLISILNWNNWNSTIETVNSVLQSDYKNFKIIVLDNNSVDDSFNQITSAFPGLDVWHLNCNLGYAGAHKRSAMFAIENDFDLLWILNNDVQVFTFTLAELVLANKRHGEALLGSVSLEADGKTVHFGGGAEMMDDSVIDGSFKYNHFAGKNYFATAINERAVSDIEGASFVIPVPVIKKHGFIDTRYFLYGEETDYCYTLRKKYNIQSLMVPKAMVIHKASQSFKMSEKMKYVKAYYFTRNIHLLYKKLFKTYKITGQGGYLHLAKFFLAHVTGITKNTNEESYRLKYYTKLGYLHALVRFKGKYLEPNKFY